MMLHKNIKALLLVVSDKKIYVFPVSAYVKHQCDSQDGAKRPLLVSWA